MVDGTTSWARARKAVVKVVLQKTQSESQTGLEIAQAPDMPGLQPWASMCTHARILGQYATRFSNVRVTKAQQVTIELQEQLSPRCYGGTAPISHSAPQASNMLGSKRINLGSKNQFNRLLHYHLHQL
jgi:hypothetical protein